VADHAMGFDIMQVIVRLAFDRLRRDTERILHVIVSIPRYSE
jgi:hypothetical protein